MTTRTKFQQLTIESDPSNSESPSTSNSSSTVSTPDSIMKGRIRKVPRCEMQDFHDDPVATDVELNNGDSKRPKLSSSGGENDGFFNTSDEEIGDDSFLFENVDKRPLSERCFGPPVKYSILNLETAHSQMMSAINDSSKVLQHSATTCRLLLKTCNWDKETLYEMYYDSDLSKLFKDAGIMDPNEPYPQLEDSASGICGICYADFTREDSFIPVCGHRFCRNCWKSYIMTKIMENSNADRIECAGKCRCVLDDQTVMKKLKLNPDAMKRYKKNLTSSYVQSNRLMRWCSAPGCENVVSLEQGATHWRPVTCSCAHCFCFKCSESWHGPLNCSWLKKWQKKCSDDSETVNWISVNTKPCPKCEVPIEKNGGCNHMACTNTTCRFQFCWICLGDWSEHNGQNYNCNRFKEDESTIALIHKSDQSLRRYLFYFGRYYNHLKSLKSEKDLIGKIDTKIRRFVTDGHSLHDLEFFKEGVQVLCQSRQTLMYTYVFAYYLSRNNAANIFEDNQSDFQRATEELSGFLEHDMEEDNDSFDELKRKVMNKTKYCEIRCEVLLKHVYEGYAEDNYWAYIEDEV